MKERIEREESRKWKRYKALAIGKKERRDQTLKIIIKTIDQ